MSLTILDFILEVFASMREVLMPFCIVLGATAVAVLIVGPLCGRTWVNKKSFRWIGALYHLGAGGVIRLGCAWIKLVLLITFLIRFQELDGKDYLMFLIPGLIYALDFGNAKKIPGRLFWLVIELVGLFTASIVSGYIHDMHPEIIFTFIYIAIAIFMGLFGIYIFMGELDELSSVRKAPIEAENNGAEYE